MANRKYIIAAVALAVLIVAFAVVLPKVMQPRWPARPVYSASWWLVRAAQEASKLADAERSQLCMAIVEMQCKAADVEGAQVTVKLISDPGNEASAYLSIAGAQMKAKDMDGSQESIARSARAFNRMVRQAQEEIRGVLRDAMTGNNTPAPPDEPPAKPNENRAAGAAKAKAGGSTKLATWVGGLATSCDRANACLGVAEGLIGPVEKRDKK